MEQGTSAAGRASSASPAKLCECGCGKPTSLALRNRREFGLVKGQPVRFIRGHHAKLLSAQRIARLPAAEAQEEEKLCECGCGKPAPIARRNYLDTGVLKGQPMRYIQSHRAKPAAPDNVVKLCECGCGQPTRIAKRTRRGNKKGQPLRFLNGHQGTLKAARRAAAQPPPEAKLCECGCGEPAPIARLTSAAMGHVAGQPVRFIWGHQNKLKRKDRERDAVQGGGPVKLCECGCGEPAPVATVNKQQKGWVKGQPLRFIHGHYGKVKATRLAADIKAAQRRADDVPSGLCECGCGRPTPIARRNDSVTGVAKGQPMRHLRGHRLGDRAPRRATRKYFVETGQRIGHSVVMDPEITLANATGGRTRHVSLRCDCGREYNRKIELIFRKHDLDAEYCGTCLQGPDLTGQRFGRLAVIEWVPGKQSSGEPGGRWLCKCDCGNEVPVRPSRLSSNHLRSCGCAKSGPPTGYAPGEAAFHSLLSDYRQGARSRGLSWNLGGEEFRRLTSLDCHYCGSAPSKAAGRSLSSGTYTYNGLDRVDNALGYEPGNVVPACWQCNRAKMAMPYEDFLAWIARLASFHFFRPDMTPVGFLKPPA
jgi:hypothetical protein